MRNFARALKFSWAYWPRLLLSFLAATMVAVLWSTNLSLIYPMLKVMQDKKTLQQSVDDDIKDDQKKANEPGRLKDVIEKRENIAYLSNYLESHPPEELIEQKLRSSIKELAKLEGELHELNRKLWWRTQLKAHVVDRLPASSFETFVLIIVVIIVGMALKGFFEFWQESLVGGVVCRSLLDLRNRFYRSAIHQDPRQLQEIGTAELMSRVTNDTEQVGTGMKVLYGKMIVEPLKMLGCIAGARIGACCCSCHAPGHGSPPRWCSVRPARPGSLVPTWRASVRPSTLTRALRTGCCPSAPCSTTRSSPRSRCCNPAVARPPSNDYPPSTPRC